MPEVIYKLLSVICPAEYSRKCCAFGGVQIVDDCPFRTDQNQALCITSASDKTEAKKLKMKFDKGDRYFEKELFEYVDDPIIESAESGVASQIKVPKGIPAGGIRISVTGKNLAYIQKPQMYVYYEKKMFISECTVQSNTSMMCSSPVIEADETKLDADNPLKLEYGFRMDNVSGVQNLTLNKDFSPFLLFPNPVFVPFDKEVKYYKSEYLNINVRLVSCQKS
jgi:plexin A